MNLDGFTALGALDHREAVMNGVQAALKAGGNLYEPLAAEPELEVDRQPLPRLWDGCACVELDRKRDHRHPQPMRAGTPPSRPANSRRMKNGPYE